MKYLIFLIFCLNICTPVFSQSAGLTLDFSDTLSLGKKNRFSLMVNDYLEDKLQDITGEKLKIPSSELEYNGEKVKMKSCKTRGQTTLYFRRKSYSISLEDPIVIGEDKVKKLAINNLAMDRNYYRNRLSFMLMDRIDIFHLDNVFAELMINGNTAGLYLAIQKPEDYMRSLDSKLLVRRGYNEKFLIEESDGKGARDQIKRLREITKFTRRYEGQQLYDTLNVVVDMDHYFKWLAFNYLIRNGDYTDELFLYLTKDENRFDIIPWDYDDIFMRQPHDGFENRNKVMDHKLIYSGEEHLDIVIDNDKFLYQKFLRSFEEILEILNPDVIKECFEKVYKELYPYYTDHELIAQSEYDQSGLTDLNNLKEDMQSHFQTIYYQRQSVEMLIASELEDISE
jgi:spore coat protein H